jgi:hypothetical protein
MAFALTAALAAASPAMAKECVEPYGETVQISEIETIVRIKPECEVLQRAVIAERTGIAPSEITLGSAVVFDNSPEPKASLLPPLPDSDVLAPRRVSAKRPVSCSDPAVCGRNQIALVEKPLNCDAGRGYTVGVSDSLTEVRIVDSCRHLLHPKGSALTAVVPSVLAPDWELDSGPSPRKLRRRSKSMSNSDTGAPSADSTGKATPTEQLTSGGSTIGAANLVTIEWQSADLYRGRASGLVATRNRRYWGTLA